MPGGFWPRRTGTGNGGRQRKRLRAAFRHDRRFCRNSARHPGSCGGWTGRKRLSMDSYPLIWTERMLQWPKHRGGIDMEDYLEELNEDQRGRPPLRRAICVWWPVPGSRQNQNTDGPVPVSGGNAGDFHGQSAVRHLYQQGGGRNEKADPSAAGRIRIWGGLPPSTASV